MAGERRLLGIAFDPRFATNRYLYVYYTMLAMLSKTPYNRVVSFTADPQNSNQLKMGSTKVLLTFDPLDATTTNHDGGALHYWEAGMLYAALGDNVSCRGP